MSVIICKPSHQDITQLSHLFDDYRVFYKQVSDKKLAQRFIEARLDKQDSVIFVAKKNQQLLGFTQLYPSFSSVSAQHSWILNDLYVLPENRQQGIAKSLLQAAKMHAKHTYSKGINLVTAASNVKAQSLYQSEGYVKQDYFSYFKAC
ncbi:GNAT family N-acetyltransferase [Paraglaciecola sp.]|uniref:GNAT family N-acetyltransferase n=1 Tax=Paraglaciecola sp. TaxID=1920173 RepID=UPI003EFA79CE